MSYKAETMEKDVILDFFKLNCYRKEKCISLSELSLSVGKSRNWLSQLQRNCDNHSKPPRVDLSVALLLANTLGCTIQDIKLYTPFFARKDLDKSGSDECKELMEEYIQRVADSNAVLPEEFQGKVQLLIEKTVSFIETEKNFRTPFAINYADLAKKSIDRLDNIDQSIIGPFLMEMVWTDDETKKNLRFQLLCALRDTHYRSDYGIQYRSNWWVNLFLTELRKAFFDMQKRKEIHILIFYMKLSCVEHLLKNYKKIPTEK